MKNKVNFKCYLPFSISQIKVALAYRMAFFVRLLSNFFTVMITYYLWRAIYQSGTQEIIGGFSFQEMTAYVIISFFSTIILSCSDAGEIAYSIQDGSIAINLIRPLSFCGMKFAESVGYLLVNTLLYSLPFVILFMLNGWLMAPRLADLILYSISMSMGFLILFYFNFSFAMLAFYTTYFFGLDMAKSVVIKLCSGALIPLSFFPGYVEKLFYLLPFASMNYIPVMIYLGKIGQQEVFKALLTQAIWIVILYGISRIFWKSAIRRLTIMGG